MLDAVRLPWPLWCVLVAAEWREAAEQEALARLEEMESEHG